MAITSTTGFGAHDKIANAKPGRERFEMMQDLADVNPAAFKEFKDSVLMNLKKESKQRLQNLRDFSKLDRNQKQGIRAEFEKEITNSKARSAKLTQLYKDLRRVKSSLKKDVKRTTADNERVLKRNAAKLGFKNLTQVNMALDYMRKDRDLGLIDAIKKAGVKPPKNVLDIINNANLPGAVDNVAAAEGTAGIKLNSAGKKAMRLFVAERGKRKDLGNMIPKDFAEEFGEYVASQPDLLRKYAAKTK